MQGGVGHVQDGGVSCSARSSPGGLSLALQDAGWFWTILHRLQDGSLRLSNGLDHLEWLARFFTPPARWGESWYEARPHRPLLSLAAACLVAPARETIKKGTEGRGLDVVVDSVLSSPTCCIPADLYCHPLLHHVAGGGRQALTSCRPWVPRPSSRRMLEWTTTSALKSSQT